MRKILTSVEIREDKLQLHFNYNDNSYQGYPIINNKPETGIIHADDLDNGEKKICKDGCVYYLIENNEQISSRHNNFVHCIFLKDMDFHNNTFVDATFDGAIFNEKAAFTNVTFKEEVSFDSAQFTKYAKFDRVKFNKETSFNLATFNKNVTFNGAEFSGEVEFLDTIFNDGVDFRGQRVRTASNNKSFTGDLCINMNNHQNAIFHQLDNFMKHSYSFAMTIFHKITNSAKLVILLIIPTYAKVSTDILYLPKFSKKVDFTGAIFNNLLNFSGVENINLDLKHTIIDRMEYDNTKFSSDNRETFLTLKNVALKQNDQIKALEFHTQEYQIHLKALRENKTNKNLSDRFVLTFESWVSAFGTNVILSIMSFVGVVIW